MSKISGLQTSDFDQNIRPQDDLYRHVNAQWFKRTEIPSDRARYGSFHKLADEAEDAVKTLVEQAISAEAGTPERQFGDLYSSFMNTERIEALGWKPLEGLFQQVDSVTDLPSFLSLLGELERKGLAAAINLFVDNDPGNPERYIVLFQQGGLGLPDESYYREESFAEIREKYQAHLVRMLTLAGLENPEAQAAAIFALETKIASFHWDNVKSREATLTYNLRRWSELSEELGGVLDPWLKAIGAPEKAFEEIVVRQPSFVSGLAGLLQSENLDSWKSWLRWELIHSHAAYLHDEAVEANFDFYGRTLTGQPEMRIRWKRGVSLVEGSLGDSIGKLYAAKFFPAESKVA
ncbi:MAG: M13 family metallopeptidase N-terminal domain-containing protein, partial [Microbacteriaceae bacterium]